MNQSFNLGNRSHFSPQTSNRRAPLTPNFRKSSRFNISGRSTQSMQVILKANLNCVERFGEPLPVLVTEALTFAERNAVVSARISHLGFAWLVCGRRLLIWQYPQGLGPPRKPALSGQCFELQLPQSDLAHRAELVSVFLLGGAAVPSCIAVSPEGVVRYWPAIAHEGVSVEQTVDLQGQECDSLTTVEGMGCILATTTCTVALVQPQLHGGRHSLQCRTLKMPSGWLGGIGRRMSSFIFGPISSEHSSETRIVRVLPIVLSENSWWVYVLAGHSLQKWTLSSGRLEQLLYMVDLSRLVREGFGSLLWENCGGDLADVDSWLLDVQAEKESVVILAASVNLHLSPQMHYALMSLPVAESAAPERFQDFTLLKLTSLYQESSPADSLSFRFLLNGDSVYMYNQNSITVMRSQEETETLEFNRQDFILAGSICVNTPVFFSRNHGLVAVSSNDLIVPDFNTSITLNTTSQDTTTVQETMGNLTLYNLDPVEMFSAFKDTLSQMKAAFIFHVKNQQIACQDILQELFLHPGSFSEGVDAVLDEVAISVCLDLLNDIPTGDPRWSSDTPPGLGSSYSMQVLQQLEDKQKALNLFVRFLRANELWTRLSAVKTRGTVMATVHIIGEFLEKVLASILLKSLGTNDVTEKAIQRTIKHLDARPESSLTDQDVFYKEVTSIYIVFQEMVSICKEAVHSDINPTEGAVLLKETNDIILAVLKEVVIYRQTNAENFTSTSKVSTEYLPWTSASGPEGLLESLMLQQSLTCNYGAQQVSDLDLQNVLYDQFVNLVDIILDGRKCHLESIKGTSREEILLRQYQNDRNKLIKPLVLDKQWERSALLAEKYLDFETLVLICEITDNQTRLDDYMERFEDIGFLEYVYSWYLQENKQGKLINRCRKIDKTRSNQKLAALLGNHPSLSWLQNVYEGKFDAAGDTLLGLARSETESITRQKTMLSFCKLAKLAAPERNGAYIDHVNSQLELVAFQEELPNYVLELFGYDTTNPRVIPPRDLIILYICSEYKDATELEFKKALDLLRYVELEEDFAEINLKIWRSAIARDSWQDKNLDSPLEVLQGKMFYKLADLSVTLGADADTLLPPLDVLIEDPDLMSLQDNKGFQYLLKTAYEYLTTK